VSQSPNPKPISLLVVIYILLSSCISTNPQHKQNFVSSSREVVYNWNEAISKVSTGIVNIQYDVPVSFDGKWNGSSYATGFIVDAKRGIILSNRHVVTPGPTTAKGILFNNEEIELTPLYIDPVHDFGFFSYDPKQIKYFTPNSILLSPESVFVGQDIRIVGNDAGQKLSILDGTISRLDRAAPNYGRWSYNDFNTYYIQAATASTGGSSGAPVINIKGEAVALNAGSQNQSANAFFMPLDNVVKALNKLKLNEPIARGTLQTTFKVSSYVELIRLGLDKAIETKFRSKYPNIKGLLVIDSIVPGSFAAEKMAVGDILMTMNGEPVTNFLDLEASIDAAVGKSTAIELLRSGQLLQVTVKVEDLSALSPRSYVKFDSSIFHTLSYQQARHFNRPIAGAYVAYSGAAFSAAGIGNHSVIIEFNGEKIENVEQLATQLSTIPTGERVHVRYVAKSQPAKVNYASVEINRKWFTQKLCQQNQQAGYWDCKPLQRPNEITKAKSLLPIEHEKPTSSGIERVANSLVEIQFTGPFAIQGRAGNRIRRGTGIIVDKTKGLVVTDRSVVFSQLGDVKLTFKNKLQISGKVEYIHPIHNLALISYPVELMQGIKVDQVTWSEKPNKIGETVRQVGLNNDGELEKRVTQIDSIKELWAKEFNVPQYVDYNIKVIDLVNPNTSLGGVLIDKNNDVSALWATFEESQGDGKSASSFSYGIANEHIKSIIALAAQERVLYSLELGLTEIAPVTAFQQGVAEQWLEKLQRQDGSNSKFLSIYRIMANSPSATVFQRGDILLAINDIAVATFSQVEKLSQKPSIKVTYSRDGEVHHQQVSTRILSGVDVDRVFFWAGLYLHQPHRAAQFQGGIGNNGLYISSYQYGSPATRYSIYAMRRIIEIDDVQIKTADDFIAAVKTKRHQESVIIKTIDFQNEIALQTLRLDTHYWPFSELFLENGQWQRIEYTL